jgi:hypothetical protein
MSADVFSNFNNTLCLVIKAYGLETFQAGTVCVCATDTGNLTPTIKT